MIDELQQHVGQLYKKYGYSKPMGMAADNDSSPHYFLHRQFLNEQDLLIIFNTKRCRYQCYFCNLPSKSSKKWIPTVNILSQFEYVITELKHSLSVINRLTLSNEGSVLDADTFPRDALITITKCSKELRRLRKMVFETRMEFVTTEYIRELEIANPEIRIDILTGFETISEDIRDEILHKREPIEVFLQGLDSLAETAASLTAYVLFKPTPYMTDEEAKIEAENSIDFLNRVCNERHVPLTIRLNPMYGAKGTPWVEYASAYQDYSPPRLSDVMDLAKRKRTQGINLYIGLSTEGLEFPQYTYRSRDDFSIKLLKQAIEFNQQ